MHAEIFYQSNTKQAIPLVLLTDEAYQHDLTASERQVLAAQGFTGALGDVGCITEVDGTMCRAYVGLGDGAKEALALAYAATRLPEACYATEASLSHEAWVAWSLAQYQFDRYKKPASSLRQLEVPEHLLPTVLSEAQAVFLVRDLINTPTNDMGPGDLAEVMSGLSKAHGGVFEEFVGEDLLQEGFPAVYAVGRAAMAPPRMLSLRWGDEAHPKVTLVGKGVTFDSGGLDIKPSSGMRLMKKDMGGAAHVIGLAQWLMSRHAAIRLQVLIPAVENAIGPASYRPGDVISMRNGLKVEIHNTDAEGRLVLADALTKACEDNPDLILDFATLTGAARVAVGTEIAAMFTNRDELADAITASARDVHDPVWRLPLFEGYSELFSSSIADLSNATASPYAGAITAALFLQRFITSELPWVHFDIMAWNVSNKPGKPEGGEAMGLRAVGKYLFSRYGFSQ